MRGEALYPDSVPYAPNQSDPEEIEGLPMPRRIWAIAAISFGMSLFVLDGAIANVALPTIANDLGVDDGVVTNVVTVYQLLLVMLLLPFASLGDRIGQRSLYQIGQIFFLFASGAALFVSDFTGLLIVRAFQAVGAGMSLAVAVAILREIYPARSLGSGLGLNSVIVASSAALAPTLGGYIVAHLDWRWIFAAAAPLALISLILGRSLPRPVRHDRKVEWLSGGLSAATFLFLIGGLQLAAHGGGVYGWLMMAIGAVLTGLLVRRETGRDNPVLPVDLIANPVVGLSVLATICAFIAAGTIMLSLPFRFQHAMGFRPDEIGLLLLPFPLTMMFVSPFAGWLSDRIAPTKLGVTGMMVAVSGFTALLFMSNDSAFIDIAWRIALTAVGFGLFFSPNSRLVIGRVPRSRSAAAGGLLSTGRLLGQTLAASMVGVLLAMNVGQGSAPILLAGGLALLAALCSLVRFRTARRSRAAADQSTQSRPISR